MKAVAFKQPWASAIIKGMMSSIAPGYDLHVLPGGRTVAVYASLTLDTSPYLDAVELFRLRTLMPLCNLPLGKLLGTVTVMKIFKKDGKTIWMLADPKELPEPLPCRGQKGSWDLHFSLAGKMGVK